MSEIIDVFEEMKRILHGNGVSDEEILAAETELGLSFSDEYREYLKRYGIAAYRGHELTGITKSPRLNVVAVTKAEKEKNPDIPGNYYVIECTNIEEVVVWQSSEGKIYCSSPNLPAEELCESLSQYISK